MTPSSQFIVDTFMALIEPSELPYIEDWVESSLMLPTSSEPGPFSLKRTPYMRQIMHDCSPQSPVTDITIVFGSQMGKTTLEMGVKSYNAKVRGIPQGFAFSDEGELKNFIKNKFDPFVAGNPVLKDLFGSTLAKARYSGDSLTEKQYPGGFLKFMATTSESAMRSDSLAFVIGDEVDAWPRNVNDGGNPIKLLERRTNTYGETAKRLWSSTPKGFNSLILDLVKESTNNRYYVKCPHCDEYLTLEFTYMKWELEGDSVVKAWMECPHCSGKIEDADKERLLQPEYGARWMATNASAPLTRQGYFLPSTYCPVGWLSWRQIAQEYYNAENSKTDKQNLMTAFYNTVLCQLYTEIETTLTAKDVQARAFDTDYQRGIVPSWCLVLTSGADVQKNRIEVTITGWGRRGRNIPIDHMIIDVPPDEEISMVDGQAWREYNDTVLNGSWLREDGFVMETFGNGLDRSYKSDTIDNVYMTYQNPRLYPIRGINDDKGSYTPSRKDSRRLRGAMYLDAPVSEIKRLVYAALKIQDNEKGDMPNVCFFPRDLPQEFYEQLCSEQQVQEGKRLEWRKKRERNEALDCRVYNYAVYYHLKFDGFSDEDWEMVRIQQQEHLKQMDETRRKVVARKNARRVINSGIFG